MRGFRPGHRGAKQVLGKLEAEVMQVLWQQPGQAVSEVEAQLRRKREIDIPVKFIEHLSCLNKN